ncbi:hypothetical protein WKV44_00885 [Spirochaetia bacterium 38H-sp]|uniref:Carbohydrate metabolism domain-containing protein n=1 Tax=Rarispira pelagica TaxID=3141764 RepID=A0ABU9U8U8_9SPIR
MKNFFLVFILSGIFLSCQIQDFLSEYRGVNLIENFPFSSANWQADDSTATYMLWEEESSVQYNGVNAYRLRTVNLMSNGDFETGAITGWAGTGTAALTDETGSPLRGTHSLKIDLSDNGSNLAYFDMSNLTDAANYPDSASMSVRFVYKPETVSATIPMEYRAGLTNTDEKAYGISLSADSNITLVFPSDSSASNGFLWNLGFASQYLIFNSPASPVTNMVFLIDDVRITRTDAPIWVRLRLRKEGDTPQPLLTGTYRLSFMVRQDTVSANNVFDASRISVRINTYYDSAVDSFIDNGGIYGINAESSWSSGWQSVSTDIPVVISAESSASDPVMEICISASDPSSVFYMDAGSILVASPSLELIE